MVSLSAAGFTVALEVLPARHPKLRSADTSVQVNVNWVADNEHTGPTPSPPPPPVPPVPIGSEAGVAWGMDKMGELVSPLNLVDGGSKGLHGVSSGVLFARRDTINSTAWERAFFTTVDAGIVSWGSPDPFPTPIHDQPDLSYGASFLLFDNIWNTNCEWPYR